MLAEHGDTCDVRIVGDGEVCEGVPSRHVRALVGSEDAHRRMSMHVAAWLQHLTFLLILTAAIYFCDRTRSWESPASKTRLKSTEAVHEPTPFVSSRSSASLFRQ